MKALVEAAIAEAAARGPRCRAGLRLASLLLVLLGLGLSAARPALAQNEPRPDRFFHIAAGPADGSSFTVAGFLASALSSPSGARPCDRGGSCGVPGLIAVVDAVASPIEAVAMLQAKRTDAALASADAIHGDQLRSVGTLFYRELQLVVPAASAIQSPADLKGKKLTLAGRTAESGRLAKLLGERAAFLQKSKRETVAEMTDALSGLSNGTIAAMLVVGTAPIPELVDFSRSMPVRLIELTAETIGLRNTQGFGSCLVPANSYAGTDETRTLCVPTALLVGADAPDDLVYAITAALWRESTLRLLANGGPGARALNRAKAVTDLAVPLHPGAARWYEEQRTRVPATTVN